MTNREKLNAMTNEELSKFLCGLMNADDCDTCPAQEYCKIGRNGFLAWLKADTEIKTEQKGQYNI